ncbi:hypothetical protein JCM10908_003393 [Rhodotorula pacifica]|uniref:uncharacterized protein n=1 Tax=Rhodotorula pacifica TaxID=1495444 RepID=UPI0031755B52
MSSNNSVANAVDRLTTLPTELFEHICKMSMITKRDHSRLSLVSKAFLAVARKKRFSTVTVTKYRQLSRLCELAASSPFAESIEELTLSLKGDDDGGTPKTADFHKLLKRLPNVHKLVLVNANRLAKAVLCPPEASRRKSKRLPGTSALPRLKHLEINDSLDGYACPFDLYHYRHLGRYEQLTEINLVVPRAPSTIGRLSGKGETWDWQRRHTFWLRLQGYLFDQLPVRELIASFPDLGALVLEDLTDTSSDVFGPLLDAAWNPDMIAIFSCYRFADNPLPVNYLGNFVNSHFLQVLEFRFGTWHSGLIAQVSKLPRLTTILFQPGAYQTDADIRALLTYPTKPPLLELIEANESPMVDEWGEYIDAFDADFTLEGTIENLSLSETVGVRLLGSSIDIARRERDRRARVAARQARQKKK